MLPATFNYALLRLQRPQWVPEQEFDDAVNILRAARVFVDLVQMADLVKRDPQNGFWLLWVFTAGTGECWLRFRWSEPYASEVTVEVR